MRSTAVCAKRCRASRSCPPVKARGLLGEYSEGAEPEAFASDQRGRGIEADSGLVTNK